MVEDFPLNVATPVALLHDTVKWATGEGVLVGLGVGFGVGLGVGRGVGLGVLRGVGLGVGVTTAGATVGEGQ